MGSGFSGFRNVVAATDIIHDRVHQGTVFTANHINLAAINNEFIDMLVRVPANWSAHLRWQGSVSGDALGTMFNGPTVTDDGTPITPINFNGFSTLTPKVLIFHTPTVADPGAPVLENIYIPGGAHGQSHGGQGGSFEEVIIPPGDFLGRLTNISGNNAIIQIIVTWYEPQKRVPVLDGLGNGMTRIIEDSTGLFRATAYTDNTT